jgi:hypothetical protein
MTTVERDLDLVRTSARDLARKFDLDYWRDKDQKGGRTLPVVANPEDGRFVCPGSLITRCRQESSSAISN